MGKGSAAGAAPLAAGHTPGPWHWDSDPIKDHPDNRVRFRVCAKGRTITQCYYPSGDGIAEADTRLIAAAPDLLEALEVAASIIGHPDDAMSKHIQSAISKAKGETP